MLSRLKSAHESAAEIISCAGGRIVGRTRLQKIAYLLEITGQGTGFAFEYRHYGPFSENLASAVKAAKIFGLIRETEHPTTWGGWYSTFDSEATYNNTSDLKTNFVNAAAAANPVELELAATAAYFAQAGEIDPWNETARRKPEKANSIEAAKLLYKQLCTFSLPKALPKIV